MNNFTLSLRTDREVAVMHPSGYLDDLGAERIVEAGDELLRSGCTRLVFNCSGIRYINSIGVSILASLVQKAREAGCALYFTDVDRLHREIFELMGITRHVEVVGSEGDAIRVLCGSD